MTLPPYATELNPVERLWLYPGQRLRSGRIYEDLDAVEEAAVAVLQATSLDPEKVRASAWWVPAGLRVNPGKCIRHMPPKQYYRPPPRS